MQKKKTLRMKTMALDQLKKWMKILLLVRNISLCTYLTNIVEAKALAEQAMSDPLGAATKSLDKVKFW